MTFSFPATLGGLKLWVRTLLADYGQAGLAADGPGVEALCRHETDVTARRYRCCWGMETVGLAANQPFVTLSRVWEINTAQVRDAGGRLLPLRPMTEEQLDRRDDKRFAEAVRMIVRWRDLPPGDAPQTFIRHDGTQVQLVPAPSAPRPDGLVFRGWATPDPAWADDGDTSAFPYDAKFLPVVGYRVAMSLMARAGGDTSRLEAGLNELLLSLGQPVVPVAAPVPTNGGQG